MTFPSFKFNQSNTFDDFIEAFYEDENSLRTDLGKLVRKCARYNYPPRKAMTTCVDFISVRCGGYFKIDAWTSIIAWLQTYISEEYAYYCVM